MNEEIMSQIRYLSKNNSVKNIRSKLKNVMSKYRLPSESVNISMKFNDFSTYYYSILSK